MSDQGWLRSSTVGLASLKPVYEVVVLYVLAVTPADLTIELPLGLAEIDVHVLPGLPWHPGGYGAGNFMFAAAYFC